jgi:hypothetical protein
MDKQINQNRIRMFYDTKYNLLNDDSSVILHNTVIHIDSSLSYYITTERNMNSDGYLMDKQINQNRIRMFYDTKYNLLNDDSSVILHNTVIHIDSSLSYYITTERNMNSDGYLMDKQINQNRIRRFYDTKYNLLNDDSSVILHNTVIHIDSSLSYYITTERNMNSDEIATDSIVNNNSIFGEMVIDFEIEIFINMFYSICGDLSTINYCSYYI